MGSQSPVVLCVPALAETQSRKLRRGLSTQGAVGLDRVVDLPPLLSQQLSLRKILSFDLQATELVCLVPLRNPFCTHGGQPFKSYVTDRRAFFKIEILPLQLLFQLAIWQECTLRLDFHINDLKLTFEVHF